MDIDTGMRLMQLYRALRASRNRKEKDEIKAKIDGLVAEAHAHFEAHPVGAPHSTKKPDA
jgi:predicted ester cyclase